MEKGMSRETKTRGYFLTALEDHELDQRVFVISGVPSTAVVVGLSFYNRDFPKHETS